MKPKVDSRKVYAPYSSFCKHDSSCGSYGTGSVFTPHGIVDVYWEPDGETPHTTLRFIHGGRIYDVTHFRSYTDRGIVTVAARFAREIAKEHTDVN